MKYVLGIDVGTTGTKTILLSENGQIAGHAYCGYPISAPAIGRSEQNAEDWWQAMKKTVREAVGEIPAGDVAAIALSVQGGTLVMTDEAGAPLAPAIVWNDVRCKKQAEEFACELGGAETMYLRSGWKLCEGLLPLEIRWLRENEPALFAKTKRFLSVPDFLSLRMTGRAVVDLSDLGINQTGNITKGCYEDDLLEFCGISEAQLPQIVTSGSVVGTLTKKAAEELGLSEDTLLVAGAHDQYAVALGAGALKKGDIMIGSGTCWVITAMNDRPDFSTGLEQSVSAVPGLWGFLSSLESGGICLDWLRKRFAGAGGEIDYEALNREIPARKAAEDGLFFYPFSGKYGRDAWLKRGSFVGLDLSHDCFDAARAVMEGVAFQARWMMEDFACTPSADGIILAGGAGRSPAWSQITADILGIPVKVPQNTDLACIGAAILAGVGCGIFADAKSGFGAVQNEMRLFRPEPEKAARFDAIYEDYQKTAALLGGVCGAK